METFKSFYILMESFADAKRKWMEAIVLTADSNEVIKYMETVVDDTLTKFKKLKERKQFSGPEGDISFWVPKMFQSFEKFVKSKEQIYLDKQSIKKITTQGARRVLENNKCIVLEISSHESACKYGSGTKWCITERRPRYWQQYYDENDITFYFILSKIHSPDNPLYKVALAISQNGDTEIFDALDYTVDTDKFKDHMEELKVPLDIFVPRKIKTIDDKLDEVNTIEEKAALLESEWTLTNKLYWVDDFKRAIIDSYSDIADFVYSAIENSDTAKYVLNVLNGDYDVDVGYVDIENIKELVEKLDYDKISNYIKVEYDDDVEPDLSDIMEYLDDSRNDLYREFKFAVMDGIRVGTENEMSKWFVSSMKYLGIKVSNSDSDSMDVDVVPIENIWNEPLKIILEMKDVIAIIRGKYEDIDYSVEWRRVYSDFFEYDINAAFEYLKDNFNDDIFK